MLGHTTTMQQPKMLVQSVLVQHNILPRVGNSSYSNSYRCKSIKASRPVALLDRQAAPAIRRAQISSRALAVPEKLKTDVNYDAEYAAAVEAVRLASKLCEVGNFSDYLLLRCKTALSRCTHTHSLSLSSIPMRFIFPDLTPVFLPPHMPPPPQSTHRVSKSSFEKAKATKRTTRAP
jgi:hypothetical protein